MFIPVIVPVDEVGLGHSVHTSIRPSVGPSKRWFPCIISKSFCSIYFKPSMCAWSWKLNHFWTLTQNRWVFRNDSIFGSMDEYLFPWWANSWSNLRFLDTNWKGFHQFIKNFVGVLLWRMFRNDLIFGPIAKHLAPLWVKYWLNLRFRDIDWKGLHSVHFKPCRCAYWVSLQNFFQILGPCCQSDKQINKALFLKAAVCHWF